MTNARDFLFEPGTPNVHVAVSRDRLDHLRVELSASHPSAVVRVLRGPRARTTQALLDLFAALFQFPAYFGESWSALEDCAVDLGLPAGAPHVLLVSQASQLLADEPDALAIFLEILARVHQRWSSGDPQPAPPRSFHVLLQEGPGEIHLLRDRLTTAGVPFVDREL